MQLAGTLFSILTLQIRPQIEKILKLPPDSLYQNIKLSDDIIEIILKYQISSDLLAYQGWEFGTTEHKLQLV
jgi:hypothetical protein